MNWKYLILGLAMAAPLLYFMARGFDFDPHEIDSPLIQKPAPRFALEDLEGVSQSLAAHSGIRPVVVNFWATWCIPCKQEHQLLQQAARHYGERVQFLGVVYQDTPEKIRNWLGPSGSSYPMLVDLGSRTALAYGVYGVPETFFVDKTGVIVEKVTGPVSGDQLVQILDALTGGS